jgi:hypothetical protein
MRGQNDFADQLRSTVERLSREDRPKLDELVKEALIARRYYEDSLLAIEVHAGAVLDWIDEFFQVDITTERFLDRLADGDGTYFEGGD